MAQDNLVYHYTSLKTLFNIIENQSFWLTDLWSSMDKNEMSYAEDLIKTKGKELLNLDFPCFLPARNYYALSCTKFSDSYFHFNNYGDSCHGVSIGINKDFMKDGLGDCSRILGYHLSFIDVIYDEAVQNSFIEKYLLTDNGVPKMSGNRNLADAYNYFFARIKRPEFNLENEIRFTYRQDYGGTKTIALPLSDGTLFNLDEYMLKIGLEKSTQDGIIQKAKYACFGNQIRKYYEMSLKEFGLNNIIKSVVIGPKSKQSCEELKSYLNSHGINAEVKKSKIELRN